MVSVSPIAANSSVAVPIHSSYEMIEEFLKKNYTLIKKGKYKTLGFDKWEGNNSIYIKNLFDIF